MGWPVIVAFPGHSHLPFTVFMAQDKMPISLETEADDTTRL